MGKIFGNYLRELRNKAGKTQQEVAQQANPDSTKIITQGLLAQYESGNIVLPDASILNVLASNFEVGTGEFVFRIAIDIVDSYNLQGAILSDNEKQKFEIWKESIFRDGENPPNDILASFSETGSYNKAVLRSTKDFLKLFEVLDIEGLAKWQKDFPDLKEFWVISPSFIDNSNKIIIEAVIDNLNEDVHYFYFVNENDVGKGGKFNILLNTLIRLACNLTTPISEDVVRNLVTPVKIPQNDIGLIQTDIVIANPQSLNAVGYRSIRHNGIPAFGVRIADEELSTIIGQLADYFDVKGQNVFHMTSNRNTA